MVKVEDGDTSELPLRLDLRNHSPTGFEWGYSGSGPAQLALAVLADATGDDRYAIDRHQRFKSQVIARLDRDQWRLTEAEVLRWVELHPARQDEHGFDR